MTRSFVSRLVLYRVTRGITQIERTNALKKRFREQQRDLDNFIGWAKKHPHHPLVERVNKRVEKVMHDLDLGELSRAKKLGTIFSNAWRSAQQEVQKEKGQGLSSWLRNLW